MAVHVSKHPIAAVKLTQLRLHDLSPKDFRSEVSSLSSLLMYEASANVPLTDVPNLHSPITEFTGKTVGTRVGISPILRAGLGMTDAALELFPDATVLHLGLFREKTTLQAVEYYSKLPTKRTADLVYLLDPLIATGGTAVAALGMLTDWGLAPEQIKLVCILGSKKGIDHVQEEYPGVEIFIGGIDDELTEKGYISPGLGDAGDRMFST